MRSAFDVHLSGFNSGITIGFLGGTVQGGDIDLDADLNVSLSNPNNDPAGSITLGELQSTPLVSLVTIASSGALTAVLPVTAQIGSWSVPGNPRVDLTLADPFSEQAPQAVLNADAAAFAGGIAGLLSQLATWGDELSSSTFDQSTPLVSNKHSGD